MYTITLSGGVWTPANHRHHAAADGEHFDVVRANRPGTYEGTAIEHEDGKTFVFWSSSGATETGSTTDPNVTRVFSGTPNVASLTRWYVRDSDVPGPGAPGLTFDAFSYTDDEFLDWGDDFDPFVVNPASARNDCIASTSAAPASVTAADVWPTGGLVFSGWVIVSGTASALRGDVSAATGQSAMAVATYATPNTVSPKHPNRHPPYFYAIDDVSALTQELAAIANANDVVSTLADAPGRAAIRVALMDYLVARGEAELKTMASGA